ncbi:hypothetical protein DFR50_14117 [Roseiarcus fermentans]|uniref:Secreted protein n=1 Tax=Roseiarcus fermentans TaxID=1473586 RepID=A0A366ERD5_9HYPH|nr:hypothetical protein [Roseiarcus fermentans]RBP04045.1 hypothetical protein DFR50_14117 [Roseiarcus fermentans]
MSMFTVRKPLIVWIALATTALAQGAHAAAVDVTFNASLSALPANSSVQVLNLGQSAVAGLVTSQELYFGQGDSIQFSGTAGVYNGTKSGVAAAPYTSSGPQTTNYLAAESNGPVTINFAQNQQYFGMNWGSVDSYNTLSFYQGSALVAQYTGSNVVASANGSQGADGSDIVNFDFNNSASYNKVVMTSSSPAFEFDMIASSATAVPLTTSGGGAPTEVAAYLDAAETNALPGEAPAPLPGASPLAALLLSAAAALAFQRPRPGVAQAVAGAR